MSKTTPKPSVPLLEERERLRRGNAAVPYEQTLQGAIDEVVKRAASRITMRKMGSQERDPVTGRRIYWGITSDVVQARIRADLWSSADGLALQELAKSQFRGMGRGRALARIAADPQLAACHARGVEVLRQGIDVG